MVDGVLPPARARVEITKVRSNHARAEELERLERETEDDTDKQETPEDETEDRSDRGPQLGSRDNFWGN
jgi:hypothetical protein